MGNVLAIVQARMGSHRLPGKVLLPLCDGIPVLKLVVDRVSLAGVDRVVVAAPDTAGNEAILDLCQAWGIDAVLWPNEDDVLGRFAAVERLFPAKYVVRITADCPLVDPMVIDKVLAAARTGADYASNVRPRTFPDGYDVEVFSARLLRWLDRRITPEDQRREHVVGPVVHECPWAAVRTVRHVQDLSRWRFTLDTWDDYWKLGWTFQHVGRLGSLESVIDLVTAKKVPA